MRKCLPLFTLLTLAILLTGCGSSISDPHSPGPVDRGLLKDARLDNDQRLAGEDVRILPLYKTPLEALGIAFDGLIGNPISSAYDFITHDTPALAARKMYDASNPDRRREGTLRLVQFPFARAPLYDKGYAMLAHAQEDFTVRAAGIRALNRSRAKGYTLLFMQALNDDQPAVRLEAADALGNIPDPASIPLLIAHLSPQRTSPETDPDVRIACAEALRNFHSTETLRALVAALEDQNFGLAWQSRQSLELITGQDFRYDTRAWLEYISTLSTSG